MSQVQPPRVRRSQARPATIQILRWIILNLGALAATAMLLRIAIMVAVPNTDQAALSAVDRATHIAVWPLQKVPLLGSSLGAGLTIADLLTLLAIIVLWFFVLGVVAGWEREGERFGTASSDAGLRP